ncbi:MAG: NADH-ubiquinone oxidoreductase-F iron-sulfur binding region domain-containing protein [Thermodesulfovibrionales bacterium]
MVVMDEDTCMVDVAKYFLSFTQSESCGKCPPCRIGTYQMLQILENITSGKGKPGDVEKLLEMGKYIQKGSSAAWGKPLPTRCSAPSSISGRSTRSISTIIIAGAGSARAPGSFSINQALCFRCGLCKEACAFDAVKETRDRYFIDRDYCTQCKACVQACPVGAVKVRKRSVVKLEEQFRIPEEKIEVLEWKAKMTLRDLMHAKPPAVETCSSTCIAADAVTIMDGKNIGSLLVLDEEKKLVGIFTERISCIASPGVSLNATVIKDVMTKNR